MCNITKGRKIPCKDKVGGNYKIFIGNQIDGLSGFTGVTFTADYSNIAESGFTNSYAVFEYGIKGSNPLVQSMTSADGSTSVTQTLTLNLHGLSAESNREIRYLAVSYPKIIVQDNTGKAWLMGADFGCNVTTADSNTGSLLTDPYQYTLTIVANERYYAPEIQGATLEDVFAGCTEGGVIGGNKPKIYKEV